MRVEAMPEALPLEQEAVGHSGLAQVDPKAKRSHLQTEWARVGSIYSADLDTFAAAVDSVAAAAVAVVP